MKKQELQNEMYRAVIYTRLSKEDDDGLVSNSITNQRDLILDFLKSMPDIAVCSERSDDGFTGSNFDRPAFKEMIKDLENGKINCIVVKDLSRFGRDYVDMGKYLSVILPKLKVRFIAINDNYDSLKDKNFSTNLLLPFKNLMNDSYCRDISVKTRSQVDVKRKKGDYVGSFVVFGYKKSTIDKNKLIIDELAGEVVKDIFKWTLEGVSVLSIVDRLNEMGILTPMDYKKSVGIRFATSFKSNLHSKWNYSAVSRILKNEIYTGILEQGKRTTPNFKVKKTIVKSKEDWIRVENTHEPIVSIDDFQNANKILQNDTRTAPKQETLYTFSGILKCGYCGCNMIRKNVPAGGKKYVYYVCSMHKATKNCKSHSISENRLDRAVLATIQNFLVRVGQIDKILKEADSLLMEQAEVKKIHMLIDAKQIEITKYKNLRFSLYESLIDGLISKEDYNSFKEQYTTVIEETENTIRILAEKAEELLNKPRNPHEYIEYFKKFTDIEMTRKMVVSIVNLIRIYSDNTIDIEFKYLPEFERDSIYLLEFCATTEPFVGADYSADAELPTYASEVM